MEVDIHLTKSNRKTLLILCKRLFTNYDKIKVSKRTITLKRKWYSLEKIRMQVVDLVLLHIPFAINDLYEEYEFEAPFKYADTLGAAVEYFGVKGIGSDLIQSLQYQVDNLDMSVALNENYTAKPILLKEQEDIHVEETCATKKAFNDSIVHYYNLITDVISLMQPKMKVIHVTTESACNSPPIRGPNENDIVTLLSA